MGNVEVKNSDFEALSIEHETLWLAITSNTDPAVDITQLRAEWFWEHNDCASIAKVLVDCVKNNIKIDMVTLFERAKEFGVSQRLTSRFIGTHSDFWAQPHTWKSQVEALKRRWQHHAMQRLVKDSGTKLREEPLKYVEVRNELETELGEIFMEGDLNELANRNAIMEDVFEKVTAPDRRVAIPTRFDSMDRIIGGYRDGELWIIAGRPSMGKTAVGLSMAYKAAEGGEPTGFICLDMARDQFWHRVIAMKSGIPAHLMERNTPWTQEQKAQMLMAVEDLKNTPLYIDTFPRRSVYDIRSMVRAMKLKYGCRVIFIDYLTKIKHEKSHSSEKEVAHTVRELKAIAKELDVCIVCLAQINRNVEGRQDKQPMIADLRDSGEIEQEADIIGLIYRPEYYNTLTMPDNYTNSEGLMQISWAKVRNAKVEAVYYRYEGEFTRISDYHRSESINHFMNEEY